MSEASDSHVYPALRASVSLGSTMSVSEMLKPQHARNPSANVFATPPSQNGFQQFPKPAPSTSHFSVTGVTRSPQMGMQYPVGSMHGGLAAFRVGQTQQVQGFGPSLSAKQGSPVRARRYSVMSASPPQVGGRRLVSQHIQDGGMDPTIMSRGGPSVHHQGSDFPLGSQSIAHSVVGGFSPTGQKIIADYTTETFHNSQRKILMEETYEEVVVIPHKKLVEKFIDEPRAVRQRIVEVERPQIVERMVEVPQIEYVEVQVPTHEKIIMDNVIMQPKIQTVERVVEIPTIVYQEKIVEVSVPEYREVEHERIIEVPEERIETKIIPKYIPQYVEVDVPEIVDVTEEQDVDLQMPVPVEHEVLVDLKFPRISAKYQSTEIPVYVPRFVEVPIPMDKLDDITLLKAQEAIQLVENLHNAQSEGPVPLAQMEAAVKKIVAQDWSSLLATTDASDSHQWATNFMSSQIPVLMDAVVDITLDIRNLGLIQSAVPGSSESRPDGNTPESSDGESVGSPLNTTRDEMSSPSRQLSLVEGEGDEPETPGPVAHPDHPSLSIDEGEHEEEEESSRHSTDDYSDKEVTKQLIQEVDTDAQNKESNEDGNPSLQQTDQLPLSSEQIEITTTTTEEETSPSSPLKKSRSKKSKNPLKSMMAVVARRQDVSSEE